MLENKTPIEAVIEYLETFVDHKKSNLEHFSLRDNWVDQDKTKAELNVYEQVLHFAKAVSEKAPVA